MNTSRYVCAFRGRRDDYQVPLALAETERLDQLITDFYPKEGIRALSRLAPRVIREKIAFRSCAHIPDELVTSLWFTTGVEHIRHALGIPHRRTYAALDRHYSLAACDRVRKTKGNLFLYSPYAWEAFTGKYRHQPRKVLFQFHPHSEYEKRLLTEDIRRHPEVRLSYLEETGGDVPDAVAQRERDVWKHADLIICASSFTKRTLVEAGAAAESCAIVPYGVELPPLTNSEAPPPSIFRALFVGSGVQRKGLHHLLTGWREASLPPGSQLTLICRVIDPALEKMATAIPSVHLRRHVTGSELSAAYRESSLFVMPSLIEGFGQVFLEALAHGCPVLGTANTCLPDIGAEADGIFLTGLGGADQLITRLEQLAEMLPAQPKLRNTARECAKFLSWQRFRSGLSALVATAPSPPRQQIRRAL